MSASYSIISKATGVEVLIYDNIGASGISAKAFAESFLGIPGTTPILLRVNSDGGDVFDGMAIYTGLASRRDFVTCRIEGHAASMATVIACAASRVEMVANGLYMIHNPKGGKEGYSTSDELRGAAELIDTLRDQMVVIYADRTGKPVKDIAAKMAATTWFTAEEAKAYGFVDAVIAATEIQAKATQFLARFPNAPKSVGAPVTTEANVTSTPKVTMQKLLAALVERKLIASAELTEDAATEGFIASFAAMQNELETLRSDVAASFTTEAENAVAACVTDGRLKDEPKLRAGWVKAYITNAEATRELLDGLVKPVAVVAQAVVVNKPLVIKTVAATHTETSAELWKQHAAIKDGKERTAFFRKNIKPLIK